MLDAFELYKKGGESCMMNKDIAFASGYTYALLFGTEGCNFWVCRLFDFDLLHS